MAPLPPRRYNGDGGRLELKQHQRDKRESTYRPRSVNSLVILLRAILFVVVVLFVDCWREVGSARGTVSKRIEAFDRVTRGESKG